jgi:oxygen-dependent protoporphyrinogen oxidase
MIAIVGGGISGLAAAYELAARRVPFVLFEASDRPGGLVYTQRVNGFTIEAGADSMLAQKRAGLDLCDELGLTPRVITMTPPRTAFVLHEGRLHPLPPRSIFGIPSRWKDLASYPLLSPRARARMALEPFVRTPRERRDESVADFFRRRFGGGTLAPLVQPLLGGIHAGDVEALSLPALFPKLAAIERSGRSLLRWVRSTSHGSGAGAFRSLSSGMGELVDAIVRRLPADSVRYRSPVLSLARAHDRWRVATPGGVEEFAVVILACPAHAVRDLIGPLDSRASDLCAAVRYVSTVSIGLGWPRSAIAHPLNGAGFVVARHSNDVRINACTWVSSKWEGRAPAGYVLLRAYLGGTHDPGAVELPEEELLATVVRELSAILSIAGAPTLARVTRWRNAGAQFEVGHTARVKEIEARVAALTGLYVTGSGFRSIGVPDCIADGRIVADMAARAVA